MSLVGIVWDVVTGENVATFASPAQAAEYVSFLDSMGINGCDTWTAFVDDQGRLYPAAG